MRELFLNKMLKNFKNISTDGEIMAKIKVACFFLGHGVYVYRAGQAVVYGRHIVIG